MKFFTQNEQRVLVFLAGILILGLLAREGREYLSKSFLSDSGACESAAIEFEEGYARYLATADAESKETVPVELGQRIDINHANTEELQRLSGIGPVLAKKIVDYRDKNGYFQTVQDLIKVKGIGPKLLIRWEGQLAALPDTNLRKGMTIE